MAGIKELGKSQIPNKFQIPNTNDRNKPVGGFEFESLELIWDLVLVIWCFWGEENWVKIPFGNSPIN
jgi:hypothetical protein